MMEIIIVIIVFFVLRSLFNYFVENSSNSKTNNKSTAKVTTPNTSRYTGSSSRRLSTSSSLRSKEHIYGELISKAIGGKKDLLMTYCTKSGEVTERKITPIRIYSEKGYWGVTYDYLEAYCYLREDERNFKISRIQNIEIIDNVI